MTGRVLAHLTGIAVGLGFWGSAALAQPTADPTDGDGPQPVLVTYSRDAPSEEGDPDYRQIIYIALAEDADPPVLWVFDPNTGGAHDTVFAPGSESRTRFAVYGGPDAFRGPIEADAEEPLLSMGNRLAEAVFGTDDRYDNGWFRLARLDPSAGAPFGGERVFRFQAEGLEGVEGNVYDIRLGTMRAPRLDAPPDRSLGRMFTYDVTARAATPQTLLEVRFAPPPSADSVGIHDFDASGGILTFTGPFRSRRLNTSENDRWNVDDVRLDPEEIGGAAAVTFFGGRETPNDLSLYVTVLDAAGRERRLPIGLPRILPARDARPTAQATAEPIGCRHVRLDATLSQDREGGRLAYRWSLPDGRVATEPVIVARFPGAGVHPVRLEVTDGSDQLGHGSVLVFDVPVKAPPRASISALPEVVGLGDPVLLIGSLSTPGEPDPGGSALVRYRWRVNGQDGPEGDVVEWSFDRTGDHVLDLIVTDDSDHPCDSGRTSATIRVNAPPAADAGADRTVPAGAVIQFDAGASTDPDGYLTAYYWDFGDGNQAHGPRPHYSFHQPGRYTVTLSVVDDSGVSNSVARDRIMVTVTDPPNRPPVAAAGPDRSLIVGEPVSLDGQGSADPDGRITRYDWTLGDGATGRGRSQRHAYFDAGRYEARLRVADNSRLANDRDVDRATIVVAPGTNAPPVADAGADRHARVGERLIFDGSASWDPDGQILAYHWAFEQDRGASGPVVTYAFQRPGRYAVRLTVEDDHVGQAAAADDTVVVVVED